MSTHGTEPDEWFRKKVWSRVTDRLRAGMEPQRFEYWIGPLRILSATGERVTILCRTPIVRDLTVAKFGKKITDLIAEFMPTLQSVDFVADPLKPAATGMPSLRKIETPSPSEPPTAVEPPPESAKTHATSDEADPLLSKFRVKIEDVKRHVATHYGKTIAELESPSRKREVVRPRQIAMHISRRLSGRSFPEIARRFGGRDHTTALYGCRQIENRCKVDAAVAAEVEGLMREILEQSARERN